MAEVAPTEVHSEPKISAEVAPTEVPSKPKISTLVFMDLESTGLPCDVGRRNVHITEMSLIAVDRNSFEGDNNLRVLNKMSLCIRPRAVISPGSMNITGLYNDILENQEEFDDSVPKLLEYFFRRLQKPICLLAHNGNRFDFPVLQAELNRLNYSLGSDIVCADTLVAIRAICQSRKLAEANAVPEEPEVVKLSENVDISDEEIDILLSEDMESFSTIQMPSIDDKDLQPGLTNISASKDKIEINGIAPGKEPSQELDERTPPKSKIPMSSTPGSAKRKRKIRDPTYHPKNEYKKRVLPVKRTLFPVEDDSPPPEVHKLKKFSLTHIYHFFFNRDPPQSHFAEVDCVTLSKVCQKIQEDFLHWVDENNVAFSTIEAMW